MSAAAWLTLGLTWTVIGFLTARFFLTVLRKPLSDRAARMRVDIDDG